MKKLEVKILSLLKRAKEASFALANIGVKEKNTVLSRLALLLLKNTKYLLSENSKDVALANKIGLREALVEAHSHGKARKGNVKFSNKDRVFRGSDR